MKSTKFKAMKVAVANLLVALMVVMSVAVITPETAQAAAKKPALTKTTLKIKVGKKYDLNVKNAIAKSVYTWTTSNKKVATVDKKGIVKAVKKGNATIICKVTVNKKSYSLKCKVTVTKVTKPATPTKPATKVSDGTATNQAELNDALASTNATITIKTNNAVTLTIAAGDYSSKNLVVDAPNADITNNAKFASVEIKQIKSNTWYENAVGNLLKVLAANSRIVVGEKASASIEVNEEGATLTIVNNGEVKKITISKKAAIAISGDSKTEAPVVVNAAGVKITSSVPLNLQLNAKAELVLNKGAEASKIQAATESAIPTIIGTGSYTVTVGTGATATTKTVQAVASSSSTTTNNTSTSTGGGVGGGGSSTTKYTFKTEFAKITAISVNYGSNITYKLSGTRLEALKFVISTDTAAAAWKSREPKTYTVAGKKIQIAGKVGDASRNVIVDGATYNVTAVDDKTFKIVTPEKVSLTIMKLNDSNFTLIASTTLQELDNSALADKALNKINSIAITYNNKSYTVPCAKLATIQKYFDNQVDVINNWSKITSKTEKIDGLEMKITGTEGNATKTVTTLGEDFKVTVLDTNTITVINASGVAVTIVKDKASMFVNFN